MVKTSVLKGTNYVNKGRKLDVKFISMHCTLKQMTAIKKATLLFTLSPV